VVQFVPFWSEIPLTGFPVQRVKVWSIIAEDNFPVKQSETLYHCCQRILGRVKAAYQVSCRLQQLHNAVSETGSNVTILSLQRKDKLS